METPTWYAIDFGTSNSLLAAANAERTFAPAPVDPGAPDPTILRSVLHFPGGRRVVAGAEGLRNYVESGLEGRLVRSLKRHLPTRSFRGTQIDGRLVPLEELVAIPLRTLRERADAHFGARVTKVVLGRPARFSTDDDEDDLAAARLTEAARLAGFTEVVLLPEPVAAAEEFAVAGDGGGDRTAFVCDFGGGTSDFTALRLRGDGPFRREDVLAIGGVPTAGDAFDAAIMRGFVAREFGAEVSYRVPMGGNVLTMPKNVLEPLCSPAHLSLLRRPDVADFLRNVRSWSLGGEDRYALDRLAIVVDEALGFDLFEAIEAAKKGLSAAEEASVCFDYPDVELDVPVPRAGFEQVSAKAVAAITGALDGTLAAAGIAAEDVDVVCCTGGTARVRALREELERRFGRKKIRDFKNFHAVVAGLAQHARALAAAQAS